MIQMLFRPMPPSVRSARLQLAGRRYCAAPLPVPSRKARLNLTSTKADGGERIYRIDRDGDDAAALKMIQKLLGFSIEQRSGIRVSQTIARRQK